MTTRIVPGSDSRSINGFTFDKAKLLSQLSRATVARTVLDENNFLDFLEENLDSLGAWHNEYLQMAYTRMSNENVSICDTGNFRTEFNGSTSNFFKEK